MTERENEELKDTGREENAPSIIIGRYEILSALGKGGMGAVYRAEDTRLDRIVAIKTILPERLRGEEASRRFSREARALARLNHPNILTIYDYGQDGDLLFLVMELGGQDLGQILEANPGPLSLEQVLHTAKSICRALEFAHGEGVVHRDLKPGNILLGSSSSPGWSSQGVAATPVKVMDFGLAKVAGTSAITGVQQQLGTPQYMSPEQIAGREADEKSDLYSLGILLYELATGVRPFDGADVQSILSQHLTMPPVPPSAFNDMIPQELEVLILNLLEKNPIKRPGSAREVLEVLEVISTAPAATSIVSSSGTRGIYGRTFVGRENELAQLRSAFDSAMAGRGSLAFVVGEPGIGKTSFCEQLANYVALRGGKTLVGHCYEEGSLSLPYLPFIEVIRSHAASRDDEELRKELGSAAPDVARIVSEVKERLQIDLRSVGSPEEDRYRLLQAAADFLKEISSTQPLLVVLEDLHDADKGTLEMLTHVVRNLTGARFLILGTYRDVEVDRSHPLSSSLAELRRVATFARIQLKGLTGEEVQKMLSVASGQEVSWGLAEAVHRQTEGNPLFVQEVLRYMVEEGLITREDSRWRATGSTPLAMSIPEGLRDVIGKRLSKLSPECNRVLSIASVIGREFNLQALQRVVGKAEDDLYHLLEEATSAAVLEQRSGAGSANSLRFAHAFFRQTLYEELFIPRRVRLHQQVGKALEDVYTRKIEEHAAELVEHFAQSAEPDDLTKAISYAEMAGKRAMSVYAYGEALRLLEQALQAQEILDPDDEMKQCDLLLAMGEPLRMSGNPRKYLDKIGPEALSIAERLGNRERAWRACYEAQQALRALGSGPAATSEEAEAWAVKADRYAEPETIGRVWADCGMGLALFRSGKYRESYRLLDRALELARRLGDPVTLAWVEFFGINYGSIEHMEDRLHLAQDIVVRSRLGLDPLTLAYSLGGAMIVFLENGQRRPAEQVFAETRALAERVFLPNLLILKKASSTLFELFDGQLEQAEQAYHEALALGEDWGLTQFAVNQANLTGLRALLYLGRDPLLLLASYRSVNNNRILALALAHLGRLTEAEALLMELLESRKLENPLEGEDGHLPRFRMALWELETAVLTRRKDAVQFLLQRVVDHQLISCTGFYYPSIVDRNLGEAKALLGQVAEAREHYRKALKMSIDMPFRPEIALIRFDLAKLLLEHYPAEHTEALAHLDFAIAEFREMKMQPSLEKALALAARVSGDS